MKAIFHRCMGASHEATGKVCQDYCWAELGDSYTIGVVSDGHGGDRYFRSDVGSKSAVEATIDCVRQFIQTADESLFCGASFTQRGTAAAESANNASGRSDERDALFRSLFASIIYNWHERITRHARENPVSDEERTKVKLEYINAFQMPDGSGIEKTYGCTLMCFAMAKNYWLAFHIGDGKCISFYDGAGRIGWKEPVPWDDNCFLNKTSSLCDPEAIDMFRYCYGGEGTFPLAVFLGSDGIDDSFGETTNMVSFYVNILKKIGRTSPEAAKEELETTLPDLSKHRSKDDMSVVCCYDEDALQSSLNALIEWQRGNVRTEMQALNDRLDELKRKLKASQSSLAPVTGSMIQQLSLIHI